ncbi:hypothetical protein [Labedaea rhizosphaerae]|uniref:Uncharacterized protein n=1 Tax=Labedaea rhizosphaerae TaxID=598644 RepID=A0A4R6S2L8_LABRH|nr:hypothetical protein [Labedaea rhizosphaerae]TDP93801.1 hypothetical protein EV186_106195 [Labedaea rhizosphaerae]
MSFDRRLALAVLYAATATRVVHLDCRRLTSAAASWLLTRVLQTYLGREARHRRRCNPTLTPG